MLLTSALAGLFIAAFVAATLVPFQSELIFLGMLAAGSWEVWLLVAVASVGNTLGSFVNYAMGRGITRFQGKRWFPASAATMAKAEGWFRRWGVWVLLLSWAPVGDMVTLMAGVMRTPIWLFTLLVGLAKTARYVALAWAAGLVVG